MLLICSDEAAARRTFREEGRGDWSTALPLVLEKHGLLDVEVRSGTALSEPGLFARPEVVLIAQLPDAAWTTVLVERVLEGRAQVLVEGPLPAPLRAALGVEAERVAGDGRVVADAPELKAQAIAMTGTSGAWVAMPSVREVAREERTGWDRLKEVPIEPRQADAWRAPGWEVERWDVDSGTKSLATWRQRDGDGRWPAIVRRGTLTGCCFGLFAYLGQCHSAEPSRGTEYRSWPRVLGLEAVLLALLDDMHARAGLARARVLPWPRGVRWVLNVRHDVDRPISPSQVRELLARHQAAGTAATWYWRARHLDGPSSPRGRAARLVRAGGRGAPPASQRNAALRLVAADARHEVAHHTEQLWNGAADEQRVIEAVARRAVRGTSAHGDPGCFRWQGAPNVLWADRRGLLYTELIQQAHLHPHRFAALASDGTVRPLAPICLPHHESLDRSMAPGDTWAERLHEAVSLWSAAGGFLQILNHPDLHPDELFELLGDLPSDRRLDWTAAEVADWWRRTHVREELAVRRVAPDRFEVHSERGVQGAVVELRRPDGTSSELALYLEPGAIARVAVDGVTAVHSAGAGQQAPGWEALSGRFAAAVRRYHADRGASGAGAESTVRTNSELVPQRSAELLRYLDVLAGLHGLKGLNVLDVGTGFGALAAHLMLCEGPRRLIAVDSREEFVRAAADVAHDLTGLEYRVGDMRDLDGIGTAGFDVVLVNNAFIYLAGAGDMERSATALRRVLRPGGIVLLHHANRWRWREPFTDAPLVHLLPVPMADRLERHCGWKHNHGRVRLVSARALARQMRVAGFVDVKVGGTRGGRVTRGARARLSGFYALTARAAA